MAGTPVVGSAEAGVPESKASPPFLSWWWRLWLGVLLAASVLHAEQTPRLEAAGGQGETAADGVLALEPGPLELRIQAPGASRVWLYYQPEAGEIRRYFFPSHSEQFTHRWEADSAAGGSLYLVTEGAAGNLSYSQPLRVASRSYQALQRVVAPDSRLRLEVNLPAFELSAYRGNELLRRFRVGIGLKSWPVPPGLRVAREIVWNPRWVPPESPWVTPGLVRRLLARGEVLGRMKISLGGEVLIHGTSRPGDLGRLVSHGCLRMLERDLRYLARLLMEDTGAEVSPEKVRRAERQGRFPYHVALPRPVLVVIRYEPVVVRAGKVYQYRDVYRWTPVTPERLAAARAVAGPSP